MGRNYCLTHQDFVGQGGDNAGTIYVEDNTAFVSFLPHLSFLSIIRGQRSLVSLRINAPVMEPDGLNGSMVEVVTLFHRRDGESDFEFSSIVGCRYLIGQHLNLKFHHWLILY